MTGSSAGKHHGNCCFAAVTGLLTILRSPSKKRQLRSRVILEVGLVIVDNVCGRYAIDVGSQMLKKLLDNGRAHL